MLSNAFKFTPAHGRVACHLNAYSSRKQEWIRLEVTDSGPGVPSELRDAVFERFFQTEESASRQFQGTGLGLAIVKDFVDLHGGRIVLNDAPGGGAAFLVQLPRHAPQGATVAAEVPAALTAAVADVAELSAPAVWTPDSRERPATADSPTILVAEDNPDMSRFIAAALSAEYLVKTAASGQEALDRAVNETPDLIITDLMMPGMSGADLLKALRARPVFNGVPILVLTARAEDELRVDLLRAGAQDYLVKPFAIEELRVRVRSALMLKISRQALQRALASSEEDLAALTCAHIARQRELEAARAEAEAATRTKDTKESATDSLWASCSLWFRMGDPVTHCSGRRAGRETFRLPARRHR